jgi:Tfp pilus assembly protein PilF
MSMRHLLTPSLLLLATACATTPAVRDQAALPASTSAQASATPAPAPPDPTPPAPALETQAAAPAPPAPPPPTDASGWTNLGITQERLGQSAAAEDAYRRALELKPELQAAWDNLTRLQCRTGRASQAEVWLHEQLQAKPEALAPRIALVRALLCQQKLEEAATEAKRVLKTDERNVRAMQLLAQVYHRERKYELARMVLENARALAPDDAATHNALGLVQLALGTRPAALESFKKASELKPDFAEARNNFGALLNEAQDYAAAVRELEAAVQAAPDFLSARLNLGNAWRGQGDFARALAEYQQALRLSPDLPDTYFNLALLHLDAEPQDLDPLVRLQTALDFFDQFRARGGRDARMDDYVKDARKGIEREERRREREKREQPREAQQAEVSESVPSPTPASPQGEPAAPPASGSGSMASEEPK